MKNKILSVFLAALMVLSCFGTLAVSAADPTPTVAIETTDIGATGLEADQFRADVVISNNPGIAGYQFAVKFDNSLIQIVDVVREYDEDAVEDVIVSAFPVAPTLNIDEPGADVTKRSKCKRFSCKGKHKERCLPLHHLQGCW